MRRRENKNECAHMLFRLVIVASMFVLFVCTRWLLYGLPKCLRLKPARILFSPFSLSRSTMAQRGKWARTTASCHWLKDQLRCMGYLLNQKEEKETPSAASALQAAQEKLTNAETEQARQAAREDVAASAELLQELRRKMVALKSKLQLVEEDHVFLPDTTYDPIFLTPHQVQYLQKKKAASATRPTSSKRTPASAWTKAAKRAERSPRKHPKESHEAPEAPWKRPKRTLPVWPRGSAGIIAMRKVPQKCHEAGGDESEDEADGRSPISIVSSPRVRHEEGCISHEASIDPPVRRLGARPKAKATSMGPYDLTKAESAKRRMPAHLCNFAHEVMATHAFNQDWTLHSDRVIELQLRERRDEMIKNKLQSGQPVAFKSGGHSLWPLLHSGDICEYDPVFEASEVEVGDIVFCQVRPTWRYFAHTIKRKTYDDEKEAWYFTVGNQSGWENSWCWMDDIYGKLKQICRTTATTTPSMVRLHQPAR